MGLAIRMSSLRYKNLFERPGIRCKCDSIAGELNDGKWLLLTKISYKIVPNFSQYVSRLESVLTSCVTILTLLLFKLSQLGICPLVTTNTFRTQLAFFSSDLNEYLSSWLSANRLSAKSWSRSSSGCLVVALSVVSLPETKRSIGCFTTTDCPSVSLLFNDLFIASISFVELTIGFLMANKAHCLSS